VHDRDLQLAAARAVRIRQRPYAATPEKHKPDLILMGVSRRKPCKETLRQLRNPELVKGKTDFGFAQSALRRVNWIAIAGVRVSWSCLDDAISPCAPFAWDTQHRSNVELLPKVLDRG
jgi:hypothetical protein